MHCTHAQRIRGRASRDSTRTDCVSATVFCEGRSSCSTKQVTVKTPLLRFVKRERRNAHSHNKSHYDVSAANGGAELDADAVGSEENEDDDDADGDAERGSDACPHESKSECTTEKSEEGGRKNRESKGLHGHWNA